MCAEYEQKVEYSEEEHEEGSSGSSLDSLLEMDWENELSPLVDFLNLKPGSIELQQAVQESKILREKRVPVEDFMDFHNHIASALESFYSMRTWEDARRLEDFLTGKLTNVRNKVKIIHLASREIRVELEAGNVIQDLWADFICIFLYRDNWANLLGKCPQCGKWFERSRRDQVYCSETCRSKASYERHREARRSARRERYRKGKRI